MIAIVKYNAGNIGSVTNALNRLGVDNIVTDDIALLESADKVIFPGVGEASTAMAYLKERGLDQVLKNLKQPVLGICLGMQLMCKHSEEGNADCLGIFNTEVKRFQPALEGDHAGLKIPHMGWNQIHASGPVLENPLLKGLHPDADVYYVHSYYVTPTEEATAICDYIHPFASMMQKDNFYAAQFHPEKSALVGEKILKNFIEI